MLADMESPVVASESVVSPDITTGTVTSPLDDLYADASDSDSEEVYLVIIIFLCICLMFSCF